MKKRLPLVAVSVVNYDCGRQLEPLFFGPLLTLGNPPYLKEIDYKDIFEPIYKTSFGRKYGEGKMNFWYFFFHKGMNLLNDTGMLDFIAPNYFVAGSGANKLNTRLVKECTIYQYIDFNKTKVFETADVQCMILMAVNQEPVNQAPFTAFMFRQKVGRDELPEVMAHLSESKYVTNYVVDDQQKIMSEDKKINFENVKYEELLRKIEYNKAAEKLFKSTQGIVENPSFLNKKNIAAVAAMGVDVSNYSVGDEVFVIAKDNIGRLQLSQEEKRFLREYHEPNEVQRYYCQDTFKNYLLYLTKDNVSDITAFPNLFSHLEKYRPFMEMRRETQKGSNKWFHLHWPRKEELFLGEKVVYPQMGAIPTFAYCDRPYFTNMSANIIYAIEDINLKVLTTVLNSKLAHFWLLHRAKNRGIGLDIAVSVIDKFPVNNLILNDALLTKFSDTVIEIAQQKGNYADLEYEINKRIYELYDMTGDDVKLIEEYIKERVG